MRWNLDHHSWSRLWFINTADWEVPVVLRQEIVLSEFINTFDFENSSVSGQSSSMLDLIAGQVTITNELLSWLVHIERLWQSLPSKVNREGVPTIIREMHLTNFDSVISQEIVPLELEVTTVSVESENFSIVVEELFLRWDATSSQLLLQEFQELWVLLWWNWLLRDTEAVFGA